MIVSGTNLTMTRGDSECLEVTISGYELQPGEAYPDYVAGKWYYNGNKITFEGGKYKCIAPDRVVCVWSPTEYPAYWELVV